MDALEQIFGAALAADVRNMTAPQGAEAIASPSPVQTAQEIRAGSGEDGAPVEQAEPMSRLATIITSAMRRNVSFRASSGVTERLQYALDSNTNHFTEEQIVALSTIIPRKTAEKLFTSLTATKTRGAKSRFVEVVNNARDPLFEVSASPWPDVPASVDEAVYASMIQEIQQVLAAIEAAKNGQPLSPEEEQAFLAAVANTTTQRKDEVYARRREYADVRARRMQSKIWDIFVEGGGDKVLADCIANCCLYGTCFLVGPIPRVVAQNRVHEDSETGVRKYTREFKLKPVFESLNPMDCYPAPDAKQPSDGPFCVREKYTAETLWRYSNNGARREKNGEGWNEAVVRDLLDRHPNGGVKLYTEPEDERKKAAERNGGAGDSEDCTFEAIRCFLSVRGSELAEIGIVRNRDGKKIVIGDFYHAEVIVIDGKVVYCRILDARMEVPISKGVFYELPGSFWGESIADRLAFAQMMQNNTAKALFLDLAATGPMIWVNNAQRLIDKGPDALKWRPYGFLRFGDEMYSPSGANGAPIGAIDIPTKAAQLLREFEQWQQQADIDSGFPRFAEGQTSGAMGALRTAQGLAQMTDLMMSVVRMVAMNFDDGIVKTTARRTADWVLAFDDDMDLKGDVFIRPVGMFGRMLKAQLDASRLQFFQMFASSPYLQQLLGPKLALRIARSIVKSLDINSDGDFPSEEHAKWMEAINQLAAIAAAEQQAAVGMGGAQPQQPVTGGEPSQGAAPAPDAGEELPEVEMPQAAQGGVAERRAVA